MAFNPYGSFDGSAKLASLFKNFSSMTPSQKASSRVSMPTAAANASGGWDQSFQQVYDMAKSAWENHYNNQPKPSRQNPSTTSQQRFKIHGGMPAQDTGGKSVDMSSYRPGRATPKVGSGQYYQWRERPAEKPREEYSPPQNGDRTSIRKSADEFLNRMKGVDPGSYTDEQIEAVNRAYRDSGISHAPQYSRGDGGNVVRTAYGQAGVSRREYAPPQMPVPRQPSVKIVQEPGFSTPPPQLPQPGFSAQYTDLQGRVSGQPDYAQRDAFVNLINESLLPYQLGKRSGPPQYDILSMLNRASESSQAGYQNPFASGAIQFGINPLAGLFG